MPAEKPHRLQLALWAITAAGILATGAWTLYTYDPPIKPKDTGKQTEPDHTESNDDEPPVVANGEALTEEEALALYDLEIETEPPSLNGHKSVFQSILDGASKNPSLVTGKVLGIDLQRDYFITIKAKVGDSTASEWHFYKERYLPTLKDVQHGDVLTVVGRLIAGGGSDLARCKPISVNGKDVSIDFR